MLLRAKYLVDVVSFNKVTGQPFSVGELTDAVTEMNEIVAEAERARRRKPIQRPGAN
jgi:2-oxoglutarate ferredoxin oxidoreductase subunit alpha